MHTRAKLLGRSVLTRVFPLLLIVAGLLLGAAGVLTVGGTPDTEVRQEISTNPVLQHASGQDSSPAVPWYQTWWAFVLYGGAVVGFAVLFVEWRTAYLERKRRTLERLVSKRTHEVQRQKRQLETYNRELLRANEALRQTIDEKSQVLGMAAHDLKNPLFGIRALSEIVLENEELLPKGERKLSLIRESADEALHLIDNLLTSAANSALVENDYQDVDMAALAQWVVRSFEPQAERKEQGLRCTVDTEAPCVVEGDKRKLQEAISNLVSNALKYSPPGKDVDVVVDRSDEHVRVAVRDNGPGLSESDQQRMFAPFQRLAPEPTGGEGSSGLGLYIVKQIVEKHGGTVEVETAPGEGSTFTLIFSATSPGSAPVPETDPAEVEE